MVSTRWLRNLKDIKFPVYKLDGEPIVIDKVLFVDGLPIDDLRIKKPTLGERRLHSAIDLKPIKHVCWNVTDLIKALKGQENWFIDKFGLTFKYVKTTRLALRSHKVNKIELKDTYCIVYLQGIDTPFIEPRPPKLATARVLYYNDAPWLIYEFQSQANGPATKKV